MGVEIRLADRIDLPSIVAIYNASIPGHEATADLAVVFGHNQRSLTLLESEGFQRWGHLPRVTHMPEARRDVVFLGLELDMTESEPGPDG